MDNILEAKTFQSLRHDADSCSVKRGIDYLQILVFLAGFRAKGQRKNVGKVSVIHLLAHQLDLSAMLLLLEHHLRRIGDLVHLIDDLLIHGRGDLRSV